ncbi:hypothetical protein [Streptomyces mirabilis]
MSNLVLFGSRAETAERTLAGEEPTVRVDRTAGSRSDSVRCGASKAARIPTGIGRFGPA